MTLNNQWNSHDCIIPLSKESISKIFISSFDRNVYQYQYPSYYKIELSKTFKNVKSIKLSNLYVGLKQYHNSTSFAYDVINENTSNINPFNFIGIQISELNNSTNIFNYHPISSINNMTFMLNTEDGKDFSNTLLSSPTIDFKNPISLSSITIKLINPFSGTCLEYYSEDQKSVINSFLDNYNNYVSYNPIDKLNPDVKNNDINDITNSNDLSDVSYILNAGNILSSNIINKYNDEYKHQCECYENTILALQQQEINDSCCNGQIPKSIKPSAPIRKSIDNNQLHGHYLYSYHMNDTPNFYQHVDKFTSNWFTFEITHSS